jgi:hypothetical protein
MNDTHTLNDELLALEAELAELNERRRDVYRRSLEAAQLDKACADFVAHAMLAGPLAEANQIQWPREIRGIAWVDEKAGGFSFETELRWCAVMVDAISPERRPVLAMLVGQVPAAIQAMLGSDGLLHIAHAGMVPVFWVPSLERLVPVGQVKAQVLVHRGQLDQLGDDPASLWIQAARYGLPEKGSH